MRNRVICSSIEDSASQQLGFVAILSLGFGRDERERDSCIAWKKWPLGLDYENGPFAASVIGPTGRQISYKTVFYTQFYTYLKINLLIIMKYNFF